jgi:hypothetical protein
MLVQRLPIDDEHEGLSGAPVNSTCFEFLDATVISHSVLSSPV